RASASLPSVAAMAPVSIQPSSSADRKWLSATCRSPFCSAVSATAISRFIAASGSARCACAGAAADSSTPTSVASGVDDRPSLISGDPGLILAASRAVHRSPLQPGAGQRDLLVVGGRGGRLGKKPEAG